MRCLQNTTTVLIVFLFLNSDAYYTEDSLEELRTVDDIPVLANLQVPHECYQRARSSTIGSGKKTERSTREPFPTDVQLPQAPRRNSTSTNSQSSQSDLEQPSPLIYQPFSAPSRYSPFPPSPVSAIPSSSRAAAPFSGTGHYQHHHPQLFPPLLMPNQRPGPSSTEAHRSPTNFPPPSPSPSIASSHPSSSSLPSPPADDAIGLGPSPLLTVSTAAQTSPSGVRSLVPLEHLRAGHTHPKVRREPADDEILRSFRPL